MAGVMDVRLSRVRRETARVRSRRAGLRRWAGPGLTLLLVLSAAPARCAEEVALRIREDGRVDVRVSLATVTAVLERLSAATAITLTYQGPPPRRQVSLEAYGANQAEAVVAVLDALGLDYVVTLDASGTRIRTVVVAESARFAAARGGEGVAPKDGAAPKDDSPLAAAEALERTPVPVERSLVTSERAGGAPGAEGDAAARFLPLPGDFVAGSRATGQPTEWGMPSFVLPEATEIPAERPHPAPAQAGPADGGDSR